jgi:hypothetical protein
MPESERLAVRVTSLSSKEHAFSDMESFFAALVERVA